MIISEKIMSLRKRNGWSQEELADQLGVSRQSVSKWESAQSIPDIQKIMAMSELFSVSTDYLLRDDMDDESAITIETASMQPDNLPVVTMEEASSYMEAKEKEAPRVAIGVMLCIWCPIILLLLIGLQEMGVLGFSENTAVAIGTAILLGMLAIAVGIIVMEVSRAGKYDYLEKETFRSEYGVDAAVTRKKELHRDGNRIAITVGVVMIILGAIPMVVVSIFENQPLEILLTALLLFLIGIAVFLFVRTGIISNSYHVLLQEEDFTPEKKAAGKRLSWFTSVYWLGITAIFLACGFITGNWGGFGIIWPIAGVLFAAIYAVLQAVAMRKKS